MEQRALQSRVAVGITLWWALGALLLVGPAMFEASQAAFGQADVRPKASAESQTDSVDVAGLSRASSTASRLRFEAGPEIFPPSWREAPFLAQATPIDPTQQERVARIVTREIKRYPNTLIERTLTAVYLVGGLQFYGDQSFSGTASAHAVYLVVQDPKLGYTDQHLAKTFHREYSTLLLNRNLDKIDFDAWQRVNPPDFEYLDRNSWDGAAHDAGSKAIDRGQISLVLSTDPADLQYGFLAQYARSSVENDFNEYAARLFTGSARLWALAEQYPAIAAKCELAVRFYQQLDSTLDAAFFRNLAGQVEPAR